MMVNSHSMESQMIDCTFQLSDSYQAAIKYDTVLETLEMDRKNNIK